MPLYAFSNELCTFYLCRIVCRALLIPFIHQLDYKIQSSSTIFNAYKFAPAAGPVMIGTGHQLVNIDNDKVDEIKSHVSRVLPGVDSRIVMDYSVLIASALLVNFSLIIVPLEYLSHPLL